MSTEDTEASLSKRWEGDVSASDADNEMVQARFVRLVSGRTLLNPATLLGKRVDWLTRLEVYETPLTKLADEPDFVSANCVGMDAASALAVEVLDPQPGMNVLDICCAPGMKLAAIAELMQKQGRLVGVDISEMRLSTTAAVLRKYESALHTKQEGAWDLTTWQCDGRAFDPQSNRGTLSWSTKLNSIFIGGKALKVPRKRAGKGLRKVLQSHAKEEASSKIMCAEFDRVLVDAECTTDGRAALAEDATYKRRKWTGENGLASAAEQANTEALQLDLLANGFRLLKPGGFLIYSTCSLLQGQNEGVLARFMEKEPQAKLVLPMPSLVSATNGSEVPPFVLASRTLGNLGWRLTPSLSGTSGLFIARLMKL